MSTLVILATLDAALAEAWERQLLPGRTVLRLAGGTFPGGATPGFSAVVVLDAVAEAALPSSLKGCPTIYVGEPRSLPFEHARMNGRARLFLSYEDSATRLRDIVPLLEELAEKQSLVELLSAKKRRVEGGHVPAAGGGENSADLWEFLERAMENLNSVERLVAEFRRAARQLLGASRAIFFMRDTDGFRAAPGPLFFTGDDPLVTFFEAHPVVFDGAQWESISDPLAELAVRNRMAQWGARLLVPVHDNGRLHGLIALGVRHDGQPYDGSDRARAVLFAGVFRHTLDKASDYTRLSELADEANIGAKYLPAMVLLGPDEQPPRDLPLVVRDLIGQVRRSRLTGRIAPSERQPIRVHAGVVAETGGIWASWQDAGSEWREAVEKQQADRRSLLREIGLTLNHELGNALVSLATFRFSTPAQPLPSAIFEAAKSDVAKLEALNTALAMLPSLDEVNPAPADLREIVQRVGSSLGVRTEVGPEPVILDVCGKLLEFGLRALLKTITENRGELGAREMSLQIRSTGAGVDATALLSIKGKALELEGILPEPVEGAVPNQGRLGVFLAKEILRLHRGEIHAGAGMEGTEILVAVRSQ